MRRAAFRHLLSGQAVSIDEVAGAAGLSAEAAREAVELVVSVGMAETDDEMIVGMDGKRARSPQPWEDLSGVAKHTAGHSIRVSMDSGCQPTATSFGPLRDKCGTRTEQLGFPAPDRGPDLRVSS